MFHLKQFATGLALFSLTFIYAQDIQIPDTTTLKEIELNEVIVNASKNSLKIKEMPTAVAIISGSMLAKNNVGNLNDLNAFTSNFVMPDYGSKLTSPIFIRGIGSRINAPSVGMYVDNVPFFEKSTFQFDFFDIEKIEVLKGPQGTLYGRNSMGGMINVITKAPDTYQGTNIQLSAGNYGAYKANLGHYMKITDKFSASLSGNFLHNDGFYTNIFNDTKVDELNSYGLRNKLIYRFSDNFKMENIASFEKSEQGGYPYALYDPINDVLSDVNYNEYSYYNRDIFADALNFDYTGDEVLLKYTLSYQFLDDSQNIDQDFSPAAVYFATQNQQQNILTHELIVQSKKPAFYRWLFGAFGFNQRFNTDVIVEVYPTKTWYKKTYDKAVSGAALYHQSTLQLHKNLDLTLGLRLDTENSKLIFEHFELKNQVNVVNLDTLYPTLKENILLPKVALNYKLNNTSVYATYATGYKPGGFNTTFERAQDLMFKNEKSQNYEAGVKTSLFNEYLYADMSVFYTYLENQQIYHTSPSGRGNYLDNAGISENKGIEFSAKSGAYKGYEGYVSYGYTEAKILEYVKDTKENYNGNFTPYVPATTFAAQMTKTVDLKPTAFLDAIKVNVLYNRMGKQYWNLSNSLKQDPYSLLNMKLSLVKKQMQLDFWGKNLLNTDYQAFLFESGAKAYVQDSRPITFGIDFLYKF